MAGKPTLAVWKFTSCDGCQLSLLDLEDELLAIADQVEIAHFLEASSATVAGPYDVSLVEGSITTPEDRQRIEEIRAWNESAPRGFRLLAGSRILAPVDAEAVVAIVCLFVAKGHRRRGIARRLIAGAVAEPLFGVPESPRWLATHGQSDSARRVLSRIGGANFTT